MAAQFKTIQLHSFDSSSLRKNPSIMIEGKRGSGKSVLLEHLVTTLAASRGFDYALLLTPREETRGQVMRYLMPLSKKLTIYDDFEEGTLNEFCDSMEGMCDAYNHNELRREPKGLVILEDCLYSRRNQMSPSVRRLYLNGKSMRTTFIHVTQYMPLLPPLQRSNMDYYFGHTSSATPETLKKLWKTFGSSIFESFKSFEQVTKAMKGHEFLVLNAVSLSSKLEDRAFFFKAPLANHQSMIESILSEKPAPPLSRRDEPRDYGTTRDYEKVDYQPGLFGWLGSFIW